MARPSQDQPIKRVETILMLIIGIIIGAALHNYAYQFWFPVLVLPFIFWGIHTYSSRSQLVHNLHLLLLIAIITACLTFILNTVRSNIIHTNEWDFVAFWLNGRVAMQRLNFYEPENFQKLAVCLETSEDFRKEVLEVGFVYPPPTVFLFAPLGLFGLQTSLKIWYLFHACALVLGVAAVWRVFFQQFGVYGATLSATTVLLLVPTMLTVGFAQTNFLVLLFFLLFWINRESIIGGVFLALGVLTKPILIIVVTFVLVKRLRKPLMGLAATGVIASILTTVVFGTETFFSYFTQYPPKRLPECVFSESVNQSLNATFLRMAEITPSSFSWMFSRGVMLAVVTLTVGITIWMTTKLQGRDDDLSLATILVLALLTYPGTLVHYGVLMIVPLLWLWQNRTGTGLNQAAAATYITINYAMMGISHGLFLFVATATTWIVLTIIGFLKICVRRPLANNVTIETRY